jgi:hypothetical protein
MVVVFQETVVYVLPPELYESPKISNVSKYVSSFFTDDTAD